ncbi:MAG: cellulose-binding protein [Chloroflexi bacterium]|nr:cellulose-binding protein [Chloroflexota bacterium]
MQGRWTRYFFSVLALVALVGSLAPSQAPIAAADGRAPLGTNLSGLDDWSTEISFVDAFRTSRRWISGTRQTWQDSRTVDTDANGWVRSLASGQIARTLMFGAERMRYPAGRYVVEYEGEGTIEYAGGARRVETARGRDVIEADPARGGIALFITALNTSNYIRNIRVRPENAAPGALFNPIFVDRIKNYKAIRFMNWMLGQNNNNYVQRTWDDRPKVEDARWSTKGAPVEIMVALANEVGADPWFTIPHLADDDYVRNFARTVKANLNPDRKVYVEHSNEVWNGFYPQARYAQARGLALGLSTNAYQAQMRYHALRSRQIFGIFEEVFEPERLVRVLGSFAANPWTTEQMLAFGDTRAHTDAVAIAPYFGINVADQERARGMTLDQLFSELESRSLPQARRFAQDHLTITRRYGLPLVAYEGGQHLVGVGQMQTDPTLNALYDAANRDPRMGTLYSRYLQDWNDAGGQLFMHLTNCFANSRYGRFGSLEYIDQPREQAPKYDALQRWIEGN